MITEEMLCAAAARSCEIYVSYLERGFLVRSLITHRYRCSSMDVVWRRQNRKRKYKIQSR